MAGTFVTKEAGREILRTAISASAGAADANKIIRLDGTGKLSSTLLPVGIGADTQMIVTAEALDAGDFVNIFDDGGTISVRKADNSNDRRADGFVLNAYALAATAEVYFEGTNTSLAGLTLGVRYYLGTAGDVVATPPSASGTICQFLGKPTSATEMNVEMDDETVIE